MMHDPLQHESCVRLQAAIEKERGMPVHARQILLDHISQLRTALNALAAHLEEAIKGEENAASEIADAFQEFRETVAQELKVLSTARDRIETLQAAVAEKDQLLQDAEQRRNELEREIADLQSACAAARARVTLLEEEATNLSRRMETNNEHMEQLQAEVAARLEAEETLRREMEALQSRLGDMEVVRQAQTEQETALHEAHRENERLHALADSLGVRLSEESAAKSALEVALAEAREEQAAIRASLEAEVATIQDQFAALQAKADAAEQIAEELQQLRTERDALQTQLEQALAANRELEILRDELRAARERSAELEEELKAETAKVERLGLAEQLADAVREAKEAQKTVRDLRNELDTLRSEARMRSAIQLPPRPLAAAKSRSAHKQSLGEILVNAGMLTAEQLEVALDEQRSNPTRHLGVILIEKGLAGEEAVAQALARQCDAEFVRLDQAAIEPDAPALISGRIAQQHTCIPIREQGETVLLAMANPLDLVAIEDVERATNRRVEVAVATATEIRSAIARHYPDNA